MLDVAARLFYERGVHEVGMDELIRETGLGKATVYRLFPSKDELIGAYLERRARVTLGFIDADIAAHTGRPAEAMAAIVDGVRTHIEGDGSRGCPFNNASIEFDDPAHPARVQARAYREGLRARLRGLAEELTGASELGDHLAVLIDGMYTSAAHLGAAGPARSGHELARHLISRASGSSAVDD